MSESELVDLCRRIYRRHQRALDLIFEYRPDLQADIAEFLTTLINSTTDLVLDRHSKTSICFTLRIWDDKPSLCLGQSWTNSGRMLLFEIKNSVDRLGLYLTIGPGPENIRKKLFDISAEDPNLFPHHSKSLWPKFTTVYRRDFLKSRDYDDASLDDLIERIRKEWQLFYENNLPAIRDLVMDAELPSA